MMTQAQDEPQRQDRRDVERLKYLLYSILYLSCLGLGLYEVTAKSPGLLGTPLPSWWATDRAERATRWNPPTGMLPLDKLLHEGEEAVRFYTILARHQS